MYKNLDKYLAEVGRYLVTADREEILQEIRAHILEKAGEHGLPDGQAVERVLARMGSPRILAAGYAEGKEIISPDLRNFLFLYTGVLFAVHLGLAVILSIAGIRPAVFSFLFTPVTESFYEILLFLPFAFIFDFGLVSLFLFAVSQWAPHWSLPVPAASPPADEPKRPGPVVFAARIAVLAVFAGAWYFYGDLIALARGDEDLLLTIPARSVLILPLVLTAIGAVTAALRLLTPSRLVPVLGNVAVLVGAWLINAFVESPALFYAGGGPWELLDRFGFQGLLVLTAAVATLGLVKKIALLTSVMEGKKMVQFRPTRKEDWLAVAVRLVLFMGAVVLGAAFMEYISPLIWFLLLFGGLLYLVFWHTRTFGYRCRKCRHEFEINALVNLVSPHGIFKDKEGFYGWKLLRCPRCRKFSLARIIRLVRGEGSPNHVVPLLIKYAYTALIFGIFLGSVYLAPNLPVGIMVIVALFLTLLLYYMVDLTILPRFGNKVAVAFDFTITAAAVGLTVSIGFGWWIAECPHTLANLIVRTFIISAIIAAAEFQFHKYLQRSG